MCKEKINNLTIINSLLKAISQEKEIENLFKNDSGKLCLHGYLLLDKNDSIKFDNKLKYVDKYNCKCEICGKHFSNSEVNIMGIVFNSIISKFNLNVISNSCSFYNNMYNGINLISTYMHITTTKITKEETKILNSSSEKINYHQSEIKEQNKEKDDVIMKREITEEEKQIIIEMCNKGYYATDIAKKLNRGYKVIHAFIKRNNLKVVTKRKDLSEEEKEKIIKLYKEGNSIKNISIQVNRAYPTVHSFVSRIGLLKPNSNKKEYVNLSDEENKSLLKDYFNGYNHLALKQKYNTSDPSIVRKVSLCKKDEFKIFTEYNLGYISIEKFVIGIYKKIYKYKKFDSIDQSIKDLINILVKENNELITTSEAIKLFDKVKNIIISMKDNNKDINEKQIISKVIASLINVG